MLHRFDYMPPGLLEARAMDLHSVLPGPCIIHLPGKRPEPLFVSVLLHGNEDVGLHTVQRLLKFYQHDSLPRALSIFFGNVLAAKEGVRRLRKQPDYNRVWPGHDGLKSVESEMMAQICNEMKQRDCFMSLDYHNNTGLNPYYSLVNNLETRMIHLANMFSSTVVYSLRPNGTQALAFAKFCPALTLECGKVGDQHGIRVAAEFLQACIELTELPNNEVRPSDYDLFHTVAVVKIPHKLTYSIGDRSAQISMRADLDTLNFQELPEGTVLADVQEDSNGCLDVWNENGEQVRDDFLQVENNKIVLRRSIIPAMFTLNRQIVRQDCLCYFMERISPLSGLLQ